jgi:hypothetical protein
VRKNPATTTVISKVASQPKTAKLVPDLFDTVAA